MDFILNKMVELHHIYVTYRYRLVERLAGMPVAERYFTDGRGRVVLLGTYLGYNLFELLVIEILAIDTKVL